MGAELRGSNAMEINGVDSREGESIGSLDTQNSRQERQIGVESFEGRNVRFEI
jgi:hypothetical protein